MNRNRRGTRIRNIILLIALALLCVGGAELAFCRVADPPLYSAIVAPVRSLYQELYQGARTRVLAIRQSLLDLRARAERRAAERAAAQLAGEAAVPETYTPVDPTITELVTVDGREYLLGGNLELRYFNQADDAWADEPFGVDPIGEYGCGPTALAMLVSSMTGETVTPAEMAVWAAENGYAAPHSGSFLSIVEGAAARYGLDCVSLEDADAETLCRELASTRGIIVALMGPGHFTRGGHFILLHGVTLGGEILVADPYSRERSLTVWDPALIIDELSALRAFGSPLWLLTPGGLSREDGTDPSGTAVSA